MRHPILNHGNTQLMAHLSNVLSILLLIIGFGFVIFWHELGHFLAAKWVGIKVEQFAVGMGHAIVSFRKGIGWKVGNTRAEYEKRIIEHLDSQHNASIRRVQADSEAGATPAPETEILSNDMAVTPESESSRAPAIEYTDAQKDRAAEELGLGETEYRLSWIPIGGYVKMLGQDDMKPGADAEDPRAFNKKSIPQRMLVVSAGVIMNIILAALLFMLLFMMGFHAPAPVVGGVYAGSPAQQAGLHSGDTILAFDGHPQQDFTKISLNTALASADEPIQVTVERVGTKKVERLDIQPVRPDGASKAFLALGIYPSPKLVGMEQRDWPDEPESPDFELAGARAIRPGDTITQVNGADVKPEDYYIFNEALQQSHGKPVELTVRRKEGKVEKIQIKPHFQISPLVTAPFNIAGLEPRMRVEAIASKSSPVFGKLKPGDVIKSVAVRNSNTPASQPGDAAPDVSVPGFVKSVNEAGQNGHTVDLVVVRDGKEIPVNGIVPMDLPKSDGRKGVGVAPGLEERTPVVAATLKDSPAANIKDGIPSGSLITEVDGKAVKTWFDVRRALTEAGDHKLTLMPPNATKAIERTLTLGKNDAQAVASIRLEASLLLGELKTLRKTGNPLTAMGWGVLETRDLILQFYVTLQRVFGGTVSASNFMGPVGIVNAGARFAFKGTDWLVWFLAMISANLAVVNFLPIPIVDGGLFLFLIIEKIQGRPLSRRAQEYAQLVGLALILSVFLMVTYNDIARMFGH
jgi:regulator of sigma E protease